jgi:hypothetical protein
MLNNRRILIDSLLSGECQLPTTKTTSETIVIDIARVRSGGRAAHGGPAWFVCQRQKQSGRKTVSLAPRPSASVSIPAPVSSRVRIRGVYGSAVHNYARPLTSRAAVLRSAETIAASTSIYSMEHLGKQRGYLFRPECLQSPVLSGKQNRPGMERVIDALQFLTVISKPRLP